MSNGDAHKESGRLFGAMATGVSSGWGAGYSGTWLDDLLQSYTDLPPDALAWLTSLAKFGEWNVPGYAEKQNVGDWINFLSTDRGKGWWEALTEQAKSALQPDYTEEGLPGGMGAAQRGSTPENPVFALPPLDKRRSENLPSAEHTWGVPEPPMGPPPGEIEREKEKPRKSKISRFLVESPEYRPQTRTVAPPARWLLF